MVKFSDCGVMHSRSIGANTIEAKHVYEKPLSAEDLFYQFSSIIGEQNDETKHALGLSQPAVGFSFLFESYGAGKITQKAGASSFILFETDSSPPYLF